MNWFIKLFIRQRVQDFVQNYKDCPANWESYNESKRIVNEKHNLMIEFDYYLTKVYDINLNSYTFSVKSLNWFEHRYLIKVFKFAFYIDKQIPTKSTAPEEFI